MKRSVSVLLVALIAAASGCGGTSSPSSDALATSSTSSAANGASPTPATTSAASVSSLPHRYTFVLARGGGYSFAGTFSFGQPTHISQASVTNGSETFSASEGCEANSQTDAAIPALVSVTNTTSSFSASGAAFVAGSLESPPVIEVANYFQSGAVCRGLSGLAERQGWITEELQPGRSSTELLMIYIKNYYSPTTPTGDQALLARCRVVIAGGTDKSGNSWGVQSLNGPGTTGSAASGYEIVLVG